MVNRIIYYYQTFCGLKQVLDNSSVVTHIHVSSVHFGLDGSEPYIHLNDNDPNNHIFNQLWNELNKAKQLGITVMLMIGGAGGAYTELFKNYNTYYNLLKNIIVRYNCIAGVDIDIEEYVEISDIQKFIRNLKKDFGKDFLISMAPLASTLAYNIIGMGGFKYKDLLDTPEGKKIDYLNCQFYGNFDFYTYKKIIENGYKPKQIVMGMISNDFLNDFSKALEIIKNVKLIYPNFGGVYVWEYNDAPPEIYRHITWAIEISYILKGGVLVTIDKTNEKKISLYTYYKNWLYSLYYRFMYMVWL